MAVASRKDLLESCIVFYSLDNILDDALPQWGLIIQKPDRINASSFVARWNMIAIYYFSRTCTRELRVSGCKKMDDGGMRQLRPWPTPTTPG